MKNYNETSFPWDSFSNYSSVGMSQTDSAVSRNVNIGMGTTKIAVAKKLNVGMGHVGIAIVFDSLLLGMGHVGEVHCLRTTSLKSGMSKLGKVITYNSVEELVSFAMYSLDMPLPATEQPEKLNRDNGSTEDLSFPWDQFRKNSCTGMSSAKNNVGKNVHVGMGHVQIAVANKLNVGMGHVDTAIAFKSLVLGMGNVSEVHCLHSTSITSGMARVGKVFYYDSKEELINFALNTLNMETALPKKQSEQDLEGIGVRPPPPTVPGTVVQQASDTQNTSSIPIAIPVEGK